MNVRPPVRARHTYRQTYGAPPERIFPALCPVREVEYAAGWAPIDVWSHSGLAEDGCVFTTPTEQGPAVWVVTRHQPDIGHVEMVKVVPGLTVTRLEIDVVPRPGGGAWCDVMYELTALSPAGEAAVAAFDEAHWKVFMEEWQRELRGWLGEPAGGTDV